MPTQSRGFWTCDYCRLTLDTFEEAKEHEVAHCPHRPQPPPQHRSSASASSAGSAVGPASGHPPPPYSGDRHRIKREHYGQAPSPSDTPTTAAMGPLSTPMNPEMGDYHHHHHPHPHAHPHQYPPYYHAGPDMHHHSKAAMRCIPLMGPHEVANLTMEDSIACQSLELFEALPEHAAEHDASRTGGPPVQAGQLGLRCVHCARSHVPPSAYSIVFPSCLGAIADSIRLVADHHLSACGMAPPEIQEACDRAASKRASGRGDEGRNAADEDERSRAALIDYCISLCQQCGVINKQPSKTGISFADGEPMMAQHHHHHHHHAAMETPGPPHHGRPPQMHSADRMPPHSADRMGPPMSVDRMGYPSSAGGPPSMMGGTGGPNGDPLAPTPLQRRRDRQPTESADRASMYSAEREGGYPTPYSQGPPPGNEAMYGGPDGMEAQTPAQPNFESAAGGHEGGTPHSMHPSDSSPPGFPQYELPSNFPFYQEANRTWHCKFCSHIHPQYRDPQYMWSSPNQGPPPGQFIDHHLSLCRAYHQSIPSPQMYPGPPPPYGHPYAQHMPYGAHPSGPGGWEGQTPGHGPPMHPQHLQYVHAGPGGDPSYQYPPPHLEPPPGSRYGEPIPPGTPYGASRPPPGAGHPMPHPQGPPPSSMERGPALPQAGGPQQRQESLADSVRHAINYLVASDKDYYSVESRSKVGKLVLEEDRLLLTDYFFFLMKQLQLCRFSESDRKTRGGKREKIKLGYGGLQCVHCADVPNSRKFFWSNVDRLANSFAEIPGHVLKCRRCPQQTKDALLQLKHFHPEQMARLPRGSQKVFFRRMWRRLHDEDPELSKEQTTPTSDKANEENVAPEAKIQTDETPKLAPNAVKRENSPETNQSDETAIFLERSTQEAAKALADSASQSPAEPPSPSSKILLAIPDDKEWLSDMDCYIRRQLEVFCATEDDVATAQSDRKYPVHVGQVGIRCVHCSLTKKGFGAQGTAVAFPFSISGIYESVREFQRLHLDSCENLPETTKSKLAGFKGSSSLSSVLRKYYVLAAKALGLHDTRDGIRSGAESIPLGSQAAFSFADGATHVSEEIRQSVQHSQQQQQHHHHPETNVSSGSTFASVENRKRKEPTSQTPSSAPLKAQKSGMVESVKEEEV